MTEKYLHYIWGSKRLLTPNLQLTDGRPVSIVHFGFYNRNNEGPDFSAGIVRINGEEFFGPIEIHLKSSDWFRHGHHRDKNYDQVILHVVLEHDDEISGSGNSIDFGNRMYDPRLGRMRSLDAFASKYPSVSPYAFVYNNPISNIEIAGDSVLFYSQSGTYLGYSHDNQRYKDKNLLVIIDDNQVDNFVSQYNRKRSAEYKTSNELSNAQVEAHVAGLEAMGTTYDVTQISGFIRKYTELLGSDKDNTRKSPVSFDKNLGRLQEQQEWGAWLVTSENPVVKGKMNWVTIDESTITTDEAPGYVFIPTLPDNGKSWLHLHTSTSKKSSFSGNDMETMRSKNNNPYYKNATFWVGQVQFNQQSPGKETNLNFYYRDESSGTSIPLDNSSYKNASKPKF